MSAKKVFYLMIGVYALLANHILFNHLFEGTPLRIWKQALSAMVIFLGTFVLTNEVRKNNNTSMVPFLHMILLLLAMATAMLSIVMGHSVLRVGYAFISYVGFVSFIFLPIVAWKLRKLEFFFRLIFWLGVLVCAGIILDYYFSIVSFRTVENITAIYYNESFGFTKRTAFLLGGANTAPVFLSGTILFCVLGKIMFPRLFGFEKLLILFFLVLFAGFFTGSRVALYGVLSISIVSIVVLFWLSGKNRLGGGLIMVLVAILVPNLFSFSLFPEMDKNRFTEINFEADEDVRLRQWSAGLKNFSSGFDQYLIGRGMGSSMGNIQDSMPRYPHYESTILMSFSEMGISGIVIRYILAIIGIPIAIYTYFNTSRRVFRASSGLLAAWGLLYVVITFVAPTAGAYHTQVLYFLWFGFCSLNYLLFINSEKVLSKSKVAFSKY